MQCNHYRLREQARSHIWIEERQWDTHGLNTVLCHADEVIAVRQQLNLSRSAGPNPTPRPSPLYAWWRVFRKPWHNLPHWADLQKHRAGGGFTSAALSHHRTYGSVYGGSGYAIKPVYRIQYRDQSRSSLSSKRIRLRDADSRGARRLPTLARRPDDCARKMFALSA